MNEQKVDGVASLRRGGDRGKEQSAAGFELTPGISEDGSQDGLKLESFTAATAGPANLLPVNVKAGQIGASLARSLNAQHVENNWGIVEK